MRRSFRIVDVFTDQPYAGNPLAVVLDGEGLTDAEMQRFATWMNLSETTYVTAPTDPGADYQVRIFTPILEMPFAGHPTLGTCHAWLAAGGRSSDPDVIVQQCAAGLITVSRQGGRLAFAAPPLVRSGPVEPALVRHVAELLDLAATDIVAAEWVDNGPGWLALLLPDVEQVLALRPKAIDHSVGVVARHSPGSATAIEVRAFLPNDGVAVEDPATGSLNASLAQWLLATGRLDAPYVASQGTVLGRRGRIHVTCDADGTVWTAGDVVTCVTGDVEL
jgi:PhzF family phenazine biosynthesis protein